MFKKSKKEILLIALTFFVFLSILKYFIGWYHNFSDSTHYLWIADKYIENDWTNAINTYWGPMISWLLMLLQPFFEDPFTKFRFLQVCISLFCTLITFFLFFKKTTNKKFSLLGTLVLIPAYVSYAWFYDTPDLLLLFWILILGFFIDELFNEKSLNLIKLSLIGAALFFTKSVGLYFFILVFVGKFLLDKNRFSKLVIFNYLKLGIFLILFISPWVILISNKNNGFTLGTGSIHNYNMNSPLITPDIYGELGNPYHLGQLTNPIPTNAFDACIEHMHQPYQAWQKYNSIEKINTYSKIILRNIKSARSMFFGLDAGLVFFINFLFGLFFNRKKLIQYISLESTLVFIFISNVLLYLPFFFMERYTWPGTIALSILTVLILFYFKDYMKKWFIILSMFLLLLINLNFLFKEFNYAFEEKSITNEIWKTKRTLHLKRTVWLCNKSDKRLGLVKGMIYYNDGQYLGALFMDEKKQTEINKELEDYKIDQLITLSPLSKNQVDLYKIKSKVLETSTICVYQF